MNERIKELSKEAWDWAEQQEYTDPTKEFSDILEQKFAELIVEECAALCDLYAMPDGTSETAIILASAIRRKFGVEQ